ncbi:MAG: hypothetical protein LBH92_03920 [Bacteroidales bacterium]|jgi:hypothetical protein|nr:hypothetical protein [Bacteroidales bacterium]
MAEKTIVVDLNFRGNKIKNAVFEVLATEPTTFLVEGRFYYNSTIKKFGYYNGTAWVYGTNVSIASATSDGAALYAGQNGDVYVFNRLKSISSFIDITAAPEGGGNIVIDIAPDTAVTLGGVSASDTKISSQKAIKTYIDTTIANVSTGSMVYMGDFDGSKTIAQNGITSIKKGQYWRVGTAGTASGITTPSSDHLAIGDTVIANKDKTSGIVATDFDGFDSTESADLVRLAAAQILTNKTISAISNTITDINTTNFLANVIKSSISNPGTAPTTGTMIPTLQAVIDYVTGITTGKLGGTKAFTLSNATTLTISASQHGFNTSNGVIVQVYETSGSNKNLVETEVVIASNGNVTINANQSITGQVIIAGSL